MIQPPNPQSWGYLYTDGIAYSVSKYANDIGIHLLTYTYREKKKSLKSRLNTAVLRLFIIVSCLYFFRVVSVLF